MPYRGRTIMQRDGTDLVAVHWPQKKVEATAIMVAESHMSVGALHDNTRLITDLDPNQQVCNVETYELVTILSPDTGKIRLSDGTIETVPLTTEWITQRDCGLFQIGIQARLINSDEEFRLRTESKETDNYLTAARYNAQAAFALYNSSWVFGDGKHEKRQWQAWAACTSGWAFHPGTYIWSHVDPTTGQVTDEPHGPWKIAGRYLHQAIRAVANWHIYIAKDMDSTKAVKEGKRLAEMYHVTDGSTLTYDDRHGVYWNFAPLPTKPPTNPEDFYPKKMSGRTLIGVA